MEKAYPKLVILDAEKVDPVTRDIILKLLAIDPQKRIGFTNGTDEILSHTFENMPHDSDAMAEFYLRPTRHRGSRACVCLERCVRRK